MIFIPNYSELTEEIKVINFNSKVSKNNKRR